MTTTKTTAQPRTTARATISDFRNQRHLTIETLSGRRIARIRLTGGTKGRGTWAEVHGHLAAHNLKVRTGFKYLSGGGVHAATLIPA